MRHYEVEPPEELRNSIKCFWHNKMDFVELPAGFEVIPDGYAEIIFHFGSLYSPAYAGGLQPLPSPFIVGLLNRPVLFYSQNQLDIIGIRCFPWTIFELLGLPAGQDGVRIVEHPIARLHPALATSVRAGSVAEALTQVAHYFLHTQPRLASDKLLTQAGEAMREANGTLPVSGVAAAAHATVRTLERKFKQAAGYTVKDVSGLMRFEQVRNHLWLHPTASLAGLAQELGYADQAHLSREFKRYSGTTPAAFARNTQRGQPVAHPDFVAFIQA